LAQAVTGAHTQYIDVQDILSQMQPYRGWHRTYVCCQRRLRHGVRFNEHLEHPDGALVFAHACTPMKGVPSRKAIDSEARSGRRDAPGAHAAQGATK
jgi:hypothetical protein